jgi:hypothetical protein
VPPKHPHQTHAGQRQRHVLLPADGEDEAEPEPEPRAPRDRAVGPFGDEPFAEQERPDQEGDGHALQAETFLDQPLHRGVRQPHHRHPDSQPRPPQLVAREQVERHRRGGQRDGVEDVPRGGPATEPGEGHEEEQPELRVVAEEADAADRVRSAAVGQLPDVLVVDPRVEVEGAEVLVAKDDQPPHDQDPDRDQGRDRDDRGVVVEPAARSADEPADWRGRVVGRGGVVGRGRVVGRLDLGWRV